MPFKIYEELYTVEAVEAEPDAIFIFGDNLAQWGRGGQAIIRDCPNVLGIPTKEAPFTYMNERSFLAGEYTEAFAQSFTVIRLLLQNGTTVYWPKDGVGTGLAKLKEKAPSALKFIDQEVQKLFEEFGEK